jgi:hypothetical protein
VCCFEGGGEETVRGPLHRVKAVSTQGANCWNLTRAGCAYPSGEICCAWFLLQSHEAQWLTNGKKALGGKKRTKGELQSTSIKATTKNEYNLTDSHTHTHKKSDTFSICACHPCAGAMLIFSVSFQFYRMRRFLHRSSTHGCSLSPDL